MRSFEPLPTERSALIARIKKVTFTPTRFRGGYDEREVDNFVDAVVASLASSAISFTPTRIRVEAFSQPRFKGGYLIEDVDEFRRQLADAVEHLR
jgi:DivIVA domain-containing protein